MGIIKEQQRFTELEYCMATYFNDHLSPVMQKVRDDLTKRQVEEMHEYKKSHIGRMHDVTGGMYNLSDDSVDVLRRTGEWSSKSTEDYVEMCREEIASSSAIRSQLTLLADEWRSTLVREVGKERYDDISTKLGNDLALAYVDYRMEQLMVERMVTERMPKSSLEYIVREASSNSLLGISHTPFQSPLDTEIERRSETAYQPGIAEKGIGRALAFGADMVTTGGFSSWGALTKLAGAEVVLFGVEHHLEKRSDNKAITVEDCISQGVFGLEKNVLATFRHDSKAIQPYKNDYIVSLNDRLTNRMNIPSEETIERFEKIYQPTDFLGNTSIMKTLKEKEKVYDNVPFIIKPGCEEAYLEQQKQEEGRSKEKNISISNERPGIDIKEGNTLMEMKRQRENNDVAVSEDNNENSGKSNGNGWDGLLSTLGLSDLSSVGRNLGYVIAMLPDILVGLFTGKSKSLNLKDNILPVASILIGLFTRNPLLKMVMIGMGGLNLLNKAGHESLEKASVNPRLVTNVESTENLYNHTKARYKKYPDEPLDPRVTLPVVKGNCLIADIDRIPCSIQLPDKVVDAYNSGALPLNTLANAVLAKSDRMQQMVQEHFKAGDRQTVERERNVAIK